MPSKILKTIENKKIRHEWDEKFGQYYFSVVDIIGIVTDSSDARNYWKVLKSRLKNTHPELVTKCNQLKMEASDGKFYLTDTANRETILEIIKLVSPENLKVFNRWFKELKDPRQSEKTPTGLSATSPFLRRRTDIGSVINNESYPQQEGKEEPEGELLVDGYLTEKDIIILAFVSGILNKNLSISVACQEIIIRGKRNPPENILVENFLEQELFWGTFSRTIPLPEEIEVEKVEALISHGVLKIKLPKINKFIRKLVEIKSV